MCIFARHCFPMKYFLTFLFLFFSLGVFSQEEEQTNDEEKKERKSIREAPKENPKAKIDQYRIITVDRDTTYVDTTLTIRNSYKYNYLRKDNFGLLVFANDGQTYNTLDFSLKQNNTLPEFGFKAKHFNYSKSEDIKYYSVATPLTELYFKTVLEQGQSVDAFITLNTSENLNFSIAYKGLRSLGKYRNSLSSTGNFRFTTSYFTKNKRYIANFHFVSQDILNNENGGLVTPQNFTSGNAQFTDRVRLDVLLPDASSLLEGQRYFIDHSFRIIGKLDGNSLSLKHQLSYEKKFFEFKKQMLTNRFGEAYIVSDINDLTKSNSFYNKFGLVYSNPILGDFTFFGENFQYNYTYDRTIIANNQIAIPNRINDNLTAIGGQYKLSRKQIKGEALFSTSIAKQAFSTLDLKAIYSLNDKNSLSFQYINQSKVPDLNYTLYQSDFIRYNWKNNFNNEKINTIKLKVNTKWINAEAQLSALDDYLYFSNDSTATKLITTPKQYGNTIKYLSAKVFNEIKFGKFALDNTILFQEVDQNNLILNVPRLLTRNTLYYSNYLFKKALFLQTGFTFQGFTKFFANDYNPLIGEFYVQQTKRIGEYPLLDFFINARIQQTRIFIKAEHFNSSFTGRNYFSSPSYPYKDFLVRFGIVWNFFQ
jgi:hypothetical protein